MNICDEKQEAKRGWTLKDFKPGDVVLVRDVLRIVVPPHAVGCKFDKDGSFQGHLLLMRVDESHTMYWALPSEIEARYPDACLKLGEPEERP
jgi:hypothetical protein